MDLSRIVERSFLSCLSRGWIRSALGARSIDQRCDCSAVAAASKSDWSRSGRDSGASDREPRAAAGGDVHHDFVRCVSDPAVGTLFDGARALVAAADSDALLGEPAPGICGRACALRRVCRAGSSRPAFRRKASRCDRSITDGMALACADGWSYFSESVGSGDLPCDHSTRTGAEPAHGVDCRVANSSPFVGQRAAGAGSPGVGLARSAKLFLVAACRRSS